MNRLKINPEMLPKKAKSLKFAYEPCTLYLLIVVRIYLCIFNRGNVTILCVSAIKNVISDTSQKLSKYYNFDTTLVDVSLVKKYKI